MASSMAAATASYLSPPPVKAERPTARGCLLFPCSPASSRSLRLRSTGGRSPAYRKPRSLPRAAKGVVAAMADPLKVMIAGAPASGKGTQCELIKAKYGVVHISAGDLLRAEIAAGTENGKRAKEFMEKGQLVPDDIVVNMVKERLLQPDAQENGWLLDGYPRSYSQAMALETLGIRPDIFILLDVPDEILVERVVGRRLDPVTGRIYHLKYSPPENEEIAARLTQRFDDTEEKVKLRLQTHYQNVESLLSIYEDVIVKVKGDATVEDVFAEIDKLLDSSLDKKTEMLASA
ncbi:adenylate kinase, chloroplastic-like [Phragmites australis]|uniref:adenylate kinase, chloroplastic-like n=1 Tax=Phragmites australis TaxID=29695 RepID=UPI002D7A06CA|nr:adenylate kinase, chloroplastic-like [Phragmites australis]